MVSLACESLQSFSDSHSGFQQLIFIAGPPFSGVACFFPGTFGTFGTFERMYVCASLSSPTP